VACIDDTFTRVRGAERSSALKSAGAATVGVMCIGRHFTATRSDLELRLSLLKAVIGTDLELGSLLLLRELNERRADSGSAARWANGANRSGLLEHGQSFIR